VPSIDFHTWYRYIDKGLIVLFFGHFFRSLAPWKWLNSAVFGLFCYFFGLFFRWPLPGKFSADTLSRVNTYNARLFLMSLLIGIHLLYNHNFNIVNILFS